MQWDWLRLEWLHLPRSVDQHAARKMLVGLFLGAVVVLLPTPEGLTAAGHRTLALFLVLIYFWATEALPLPVTALAAGVGLVVLGVAEKPNDAWGPYAQDVIFFLLGSLILADAITKTEADRVLSARILRRMGGSTDSLLFAIIVASTLPAMIVSDHAVAAIMLPLVVSILRSTGLYKRPNVAAAYMLAIAFGTAVAGLATPSGGGRNVIVIGYLDELYGVSVSYLYWAIRGVPITLAMIPFMFIVLKLVFRVKHERIDRATLPVDGAGLNDTQRLTMMILGATVVMWIFLGEEIGLGTIAIMGAVAMFVFGILDWVDTRQRITWGVPLIYGAALSMGAALQQTGAAQWLAETLLRANPWTTPDTLLIAALFLSVLLTQFMSDGGTTAVVAPITLAVAFIALGSPGIPVTDPMHRAFLGEMGMVTAIGSAFSFMLVIGTPPNMITYSSGLFTARDLAKAGVFIMAIAVAAVWAAVTYYWPLL
jgi:sodium-dependent dicarboxylate transporter 2/3/5